MNNHRPSSTVLAMFVVITLGGCKSREEPQPHPSAKSAKADDHPSDVKATPEYLFGAVNEGDISGIRNLCRREVDVNIKNKDGMTPLHRAATKGHAEIGRILIEHGARIDEKDARGWTPLHIACMKGHIEFVKLLIDKGASVEVKDELGKTPRDWANSRGHTEIVKALQGRV